MKGKVFVIGSYADSLINFRLHLMQTFLAKGYEVVALAPQDNHVEKTLKKFNIRFIHIPLQRNGTNPISDLKLLFTLKKIFHQEKPDIVFSYTIKPIVYGSLAARAAGISTIYSMITGTGYTFENPNLQGRIIGCIAKTLLKTALTYNTRIFFQNPDNLVTFIQEKLVKPTKPMTIINGSGVDCAFFSPADYPKAISFLMISRLLYSKGVHQYVDAAKMLRKKYPEARFRLVGFLDSNPQSIKQNELDHWVKNGDIEFLGKLSDVRGSIADSSVYVLPSWNEGTPRTVLEAMAMARPIITTDSPGCKETVVPHRNGFLVAPKSVEDLYNAMEFFILHPENVNVMGEESRKMAVEKYDVNKVNESILNGMGIH